MSDYQAMAERAVREWSPSGRAERSFAYFGDLPLGVTYAITFSTHRDDDVLGQSNYRTILADLRTRFPDDVEEGESSHCAVGWTRSAYVRMLDDDGKVTAAGIAVLEWRGKLAAYPVADDDDYSAMICEVEAEAWESWGRKDWMRAIRKRFGADYLEIPAADLDEMASLLDVRDGQTDTDGSPIYNFEKAAALIPYSDVLAYDVEGELAEGWRAEDDLLPPYLRSSCPPWESNGSVSFHPLT